MSKSGSNLAKGTPNKPKSNDSAMSQPSGVTVQRPESKPRSKPDTTLISNSLQECPRGGPEPDEHATCAANHRTSVRLREPQIDSKPPTLEAPLSVSALYSVPTGITLPAGVHKASAGRPPPCTHLRRAMRRNHCASKLTHSERPGQHEKKAADDMGCANRLPINTDRTHHD